uniref:Kazal-like domain-containing protein n=1 Tax=Meloidogyne incognita TaxID=6306 RepID=A0A914M5Y8_MELIC
MIVYVCWIVRGDMTQARKAYEGTCCPSADLCADYFDPVCDQFGNFYANDCIFDFHKCAQRRSGGPLIIIEGRGEQACANAIAAAAAKQQTKNNKKNNNLNNNIKRNNEEQVNNGRLLISKPPPCHFFCDETIAPVCDSQSRTHKNRCK